MLRKGFVTNLECSLCARSYEGGKPWNLCPCGGPLLVRYDLQSLREAVSPDSFLAGPNSMWRYAAVLPVKNSTSIVTLGEGMTPLLPAHRIGARIGASQLLIKDDGLNPTGSFKARGMACAVSMCVELGLKKLAAPSAGNAASALPAYAAAAGLEAHIFMPKDVPRANRIECAAYGAQVTLVDGLISDCGRIVSERGPAEGWFDLSTLKEPYRIEGKKTMGYELAEQLGWKLPDAILYPTGGGVGMIGMWKAFDEMEAFGWIGSERPKMIAVQAEGCQPIVRALEEGSDRSRFWEGAATVASGLRVPKALGDFLVMKAVRASGGTAVSVSDKDLMAAGARLAADEGIFACPEGAACIAATEHLIQDGFLKGDERILVFNTGSGLKYLEAYADALS